MTEEKIKEKINKRDIVETMQNYTYAKNNKKWSKEAANLGYESFVASVKALLLHYGKVSIPCIGTFEIKTKPPKNMINNFTGERYISKEKQGLRFKPSPSLIEEIEALNYKFIVDSEDNNNADS